MGAFDIKAALHGMACLFVLATATADAALGQPVTLRIGYGTAAEEQLWLLIAKPDIGKHYGKAYTIDATRFTGSDKRAQAFEAGAIDLAVVQRQRRDFRAPPKASAAKIIASVHARKPARLQHDVLRRRRARPIKSVKDLKGKTIGINGFCDSGPSLAEDGAREGTGCRRATSRSCRSRSPAMAESLQCGQGRCRSVPAAVRRAGCRSRGRCARSSTPKTRIPFEEELIVLIGKEDFLKKNAPRRAGPSWTTCEAATKFYLEKPQEARQILIDTKMVRVPADVFLDMNDYYRDPDACASTSRRWRRCRSIRSRRASRRSATDVRQLVDMSYLPK